MKFNAKTQSRKGAKRNDEMILVPWFELITQGRFLCVSASLRLCVLFFSIWICQPVATLAFLEKPYADGQVLVKFKSERAAEDPGIRSYGKRAVSRKFKTKGLRLIRIGEDERVEQVVSELEKHPDVLYAEPNYYIYPAGLPNDPGFPVSWALHNTGQEANGSTGTADADIDAVEAWDLATGDENIVIALVDSGFDYRHPDLARNIWSNPDEIPGNSVDDDKNGFVDDIQGWDFIDDDNDPMDFLGHGTDNAGIIGAAGNNSTGLAGVVWNASLMNLRIMDGFGVGTTAEAVAAIEYAQSNGARIVNASWADSEFSQALKDAISQFDGLFVAAAGNSGSDNDTSPLYPASYDLDNVVSVAGSDMDDQLLSFSSYGAQSVDLAAPAINNYTTAMIRKTLWEDDFEDGNISDWETGGSPDSWGLETSAPVTGSYSIADTPGQNYTAGSDNWIVSPALDAGDAKGTRLKFKLSGRSQYDHDFLFLEVSENKTSWTSCDFFLPGAGSLASISGGATKATVYADLSAYDGVETVYLRFRFTSDSATQETGWIIDDLQVTSVSDLYDGSEYHYAGGTSSAVAHMSGAAGLILSVNPSINTSDLKSALLQSVDQIDSLQNKVLSGGRLNAFNAIRYPDTDGDGTPDVYDDVPNIAGDIDGDYAVSLNDAILGLKVLAASAESAPNLGADVNGNGKMDLVEIIDILRQIAASE